MSWGGGTAVETIASQGTATGGTAGTSYSALGTLVDSGKSWTTNAYRGYQVKIISGTGAGQIAMIKSNTATTLTVIPNVVAMTFTAPSTDSVYIIIKSEVQLSDGTNTLQAGISVPDLVLTTGTLTDSGITITANSLAVDPQFISSTDYRTGNVDLDTSGYGATYIGALDYYDTTTGAALLMGM